MTPHYVQSNGAPAVTGTGFGLFACDCGQSLLIAGYVPRNFLGIAIKCAACGKVMETPRLAEGSLPPLSVTILDRGAENPSRIDAGTVLISREEAQRLAALYQPRVTATDVHEITSAMLDDVEQQQWRHTGAAFDPLPGGYKSQPLAWAVAHYRARLRDPDWTTLVDADDMAALTLIAAFRDLFASWAHHPLFDAMVAAAAARQFSLHALAMFGAAKSLALAGNSIMFVPTIESRPSIASIRLVRGPDDELSVTVTQFDKFSWPDGAPANESLVRAAVIDAVTSVQGTINRLRPGILALSAGATDLTFDRLLNHCMAQALDAVGARNRGLVALAGISPKITVIANTRAARFDYGFYPVANRRHDAGRSARIGRRGDPI